MHVLLNLRTQDNPQEGDSKSWTNIRNTVDVGMTRMVVASVRGIGGWHGVIFVSCALCIDVQELSFLDYGYIIE